MARNIREIEKEIFQKKKKNVHNKYRKSQKRGLIKELKIGN